MIQELFDRNPKQRDLTNIFKLLGNATQIAILNGKVRYYFEVFVIIEYIQNYRLLLKFNYLKYLLNIYQKSIKYLKLKFQLKNSIIAEYETICVYSIM